MNDEIQSALRNTAEHHDYSHRWLKTSLQTLQRTSWISEDLLHNTPVTERIAQWMILIVLDSHELPTYSVLLRSLQASQEVTPKISLNTWRSQVRVGVVNYVSEAHLNRLHALLEALRVPVKCRVCIGQQRETFQSFLNLDGEKI